MLLSLSVAMKIPENRGSPVLRVWVAAVSPCLAVLRVYVAGCQSMLSWLHLFRPEVKQYEGGR